MKIRKARLDDIPEIGHVFERAILEIGPRFYSRDQLNAWIKRRARLETVLPEVLPYRDGWVAVEADDKPLAYLDLEKDGHIDFFYAHPSVSGTPVTGEMYAHLEARALELGISRLSTEASEAARRFFEKRGFQVLRKQDIELGGMMIHNYAMEKQLTPATALA